MKSNLKKRLRRIVSCLLVLTMLPFYVVGAAAAQDPPGSEALSSAATIAEWAFDDAPESEVVYLATNGTYKTASTLRNVGGVFEEFNDDDKYIGYQGWDDGDGKKYWLATISTSGFENITLSSEQSSSGSGPRDFHVESSHDGNTWTNVPNTDLKMAANSFEDTAKLVETPLLKSDDNQELLYIRWIVSSNENTKGEEEGIGSGGSSRIRNIIVTGDPIEGIPPVIPTVDLLEQPINRSENVPADVPVELKFNKAIALDESHSVQFVDENNQSVSGISLQVSNIDTLQINHAPLTFGTSYTVSVPKELIKGEDGVPQARDISWSFRVQDSPLAPKSINMTFNGDPKTSIALAWYTDVMTDTVVQIVEASKVTGTSFPEDGSLNYHGNAEAIETYVKKGDRETDHHTEFISHKVIADQLNPGTAYKFRVGNGKAEDWSSIGSFTTDAAENQPYHFIAGSDSQASSKADFEPWGDTFRKAINHMGAPKFLISAGDLVDNGDLEEQWQWMLGVAQDELLQVPYVPVLGGHEVMDYDGDETTPNDNFYNHFNLPEQLVADTHKGSVYSFEYGDALYLVFNSQYAGELTENGEDVEFSDQQFWDQVAWMKNTVAKSDKKWKFVTFHKSPYAAGDNSAQWEGGRIEFYKKNLIPAFDEMGIDMVFEAHDHMYMRSFQMYNDEVIPKDQLKFDDDGNAINPKGTVYLMSNAFGNKFYYKNNQYYLDEEWEPHEILDENGDPIPYDDYFAEIDEQPEKKMFTDVSITDKVLSFIAYTAAVEDEGKDGTVGNGLMAYDNYGIQRTDTKPDAVEAVKAAVSDNQVVLSWKTPSASKEPVRGFRIYEKNDKVNTHWSLYVPVVEGQSEYTYTVDNINPAKNYDFIIKAVGTRMNSNPVEVSATGGPAESEPPSAPTNLKGNAVSPFQINLTWTASAGTKGPQGYNVYRNGSKIGTTTTLSYNDIGLDSNTAYTYVIKAYNAAEIESLASNSVSVTTKSSPTGEGIHKAFPQHTAYAAGTIKPNHLTQAEMDATVARLYNEWKSKYLKQNPYNNDQYYVWYADGDWFEENEITVSEAHGYGMLITSMMAGHDPDAKKYFDGMYRYFRAHPSEINPDLMAWQQADTGTEIKDINGVDSATDGDMDIAYSLLLANSQWGSSGDINYLAEAKKVINAIMESDVNHTEWTLKMADWVTDDDPKYGNATRPSDFMLQHLKDFRNVSGDSNWDRVIDKTYNVIQNLYKDYSPQAGLLPDFVFKDKTDGKYKPVSEHNWEPDGIFLESEQDGDYNYNSSRIPWRIGTDYLLTGDDRAKAQLGALNEWIRTKTNNDPAEILAGYKLDGSEALNDYTDITFSAPMMVSAMIDSSNQEWLNKLWDYNAAGSTEDDLYFGNNLRLLSMIVVSGNWWTPTIVDTEAPMEPTIDKAEAISSSTIDLKWTPSKDNVGVAGYKVFRNDKEIKVTTSTNFRDSGLSSSTSYKYYVVAYDAAGNTSKISNVRIVSTLAASNGGSDGGSGSGNGGSTVPTPTPTPTPTPVPEVVQPTTPQITPSNFSDIGSQYSWAKEAIEQLTALGIIQGTSKTTFDPGHKVTRGEFILGLVKALGLKASSDGNFEDVDQNSEYYEAIGIAKQLGITNGIDGKKFNPEAEISRQDMMVLITNALKKLGKLSETGTASELNKFKDGSKVADYAAEAIATLIKEGIVLGDGSFIHPKGTATRAEMAVIIYRIYKLN